MTKIKILTKDGLIVSVTAKGHTDFAEIGKDIVCAAVSSVLQSAALGLIKVVNIKLNLTHGKDGYIKFSFDEDLKDEKLIKTKAILDTMKVSLEDLVKAYPAYIQMEVL